MKINADQLVACTRCTFMRANMWLDPINAAMSMFEIYTLPRIGMFLANVGHESGRLMFSREIWGPTASQVRYERDFTAPWPSSPSEASQPQFERNRLAFGLGNTQLGDGKRFMGRGLIELTGRANYCAARDGMRKFLPNVPDFERMPELLEMMAWAAYSAAWFWMAHGCNAMADAGDFDGVCDLINRGHKTAREGDSNGYAERLANWTVAQIPLGIGAA
jgi:putative chitinase